MNDRSVPVDSVVKASAAATEAAWAVPGISPTQRLVLLRIAYRVNNTTGDAWPSYASLAADTGLSERAVRYAVEALVRAGHLMAERTIGRSTHYTVPPATDATPAPVASPAPRAETLAPGARTPAPHAETPAPRATEPLSNHAMNQREPSRRRLPADWTPTAAGVSYATERCLDPEAELAAFSDHHRAKATTMADWDAAWRTWCRNAVTFARRSRAPARTNGQTRAERNAAAIATVFDAIRPTNGHLAAIDTNGRPA